MSKRPKFVLKVKVAGPGVRVKSIAVPDLLKLCDAIQSAVHRQAEAMEGRRTLRTGPITSAALEECTLELVGLGKGSTTLSFRLAKPQQHLPMTDIPHFGQQVVATMAATVGMLAERRKQDLENLDVGVLDSLHRLSELLGKKAVTSITMTVPPFNGARRIKATFDESADRNLVRLVQAPRAQEISAEGRLEMADFKDSGKVCRLHPRMGPAMPCTFDEAKEDEVYLALRRPVRLRGIARINPHTEKVESLHIREIEVIDELLLGAKEFFRSLTMEELAEAQGARPLAKPRVLEGGWPAEEDLDEFLAETYAGRSN